MERESLPGGTRPGECDPGKPPAKPAPKPVPKTPAPDESVDPDRFDDEFARPVRRRPGHHRRTR
jgi:hypothetical protein